MARGFESKDVEFQQAEAERAQTFRRPLTPAEREDADRRRSLELSLLRAQHELSAATSPAHQRMLQQAIAALEQALASAGSE